MIAFIVLTAFTWLLAFLFTSLMGENGWLIFLCIIFPVAAGLTVIWYAIFFSNGSARAWDDDETDSTTAGRKSKYWGPFNVDSTLTPKSEIDQYFLFKELLNRDDQKKDNWL